MVSLDTDMHSTAGAVERVDTSFQFKFKIKKKQYMLQYTKENTKGREMKQIRNITMLLATIALTLLLSACGTNVTTTEGDDNTTATPTVTLKSLNLTVDKTSLNKDENTTVKVMATYPDNTSKEVTDNIEWLITPKDALKIKGNMLTALKDTNATLQAKVGTTLSNKIKLNIYWEVNGHRLPPEPDPVVNNSTLLGVDVNGNGVRDDVERWIYKTYSHPIERAVFMQLAKALQYSMGHADEAWEYFQPIDDAASCASYWTTFMKYKNQNNAIRIDKITPISNELNPIQYNTEDRRLDNENYEKALSGGIIKDNGLEPEELIQKCDFNATKLMKDYQ